MNRFAIALAFALSIGFAHAGETSTAPERNDDFAFRCRFATQSKEGGMNCHARGNFEAVRPHGHDVLEGAHPWDNYFKVYCGDLDNDDWDHHHDCDNTREHPCGDHDWDHDHHVDVIYMGQIYYRLADNSPDSCSTFDVDFMGRRHDRDHDDNACYTPILHVQQITWDSHDLDNLGATLSFDHEGMSYTLGGSCEFHRH